MAPADSNWHLDKRVSVATMVALMLQFGMLFGSGVWFVSEFSGQIAANEKRITSSERKIENLSDEIDVITVQIGKQAVQLGRIEENIISLKLSVDRLINVLDGRARALP